MERVDQFALAVAHVGQLLGEGVLPLGHHVRLARVQCRLIQIHLRSRGRLIPLRHLTGDIGILGNQVGRPAKLVPFAIPEEIQNHQVLFTRRRPCPAPDHLGIEGPHLRHAQDGDQVNGRVIVAFRQEHGVDDAGPFPVSLEGRDLTAILATSVVCPHTSR